MYKLLIRPFLFLFDPEKIHHFTFRILSLSGKIPGVMALMRGIYKVDDPRLQRNLLGLTFSNPVGLAAGFDKDANLIDEMEGLGFGFVEIGTLTPKGQPGNDKPRLFRLPKDKAIINRMGFNNGGVLEATGRLKARQTKVIVGGNIGKNKSTPNENAFDDYKYCFKALHPYVDYFVVNVSSPNTPNLRALQEKEPLKKLLTQIKELSLQHTPVKPVLLKIAPDLNADQLDDVIAILLETKTDGVIATNTTISREGLLTPAEEITRIGAGGLSGLPLHKRSSEVIRYLRDRLGPAFPIIGVGGIMTPEDAVATIKAGADLVQIYTGLIYEGPAFMKRINSQLIRAVL